MYVIPLSYSCERRSEYIQDGEACVKAFLHCCKEIEIHREEGKEQSLILARSKSRQGLSCKAHSQPSSKSKLVCACDQTGDPSRLHSTLIRQLFQNVTVHLKLWNEFGV